MVIQLSNPDMPQRGDLELMAEEAPETSGHLFWVPNAFAGTLAESFLKKSNPFNPGQFSFPIVS